MTTPAQKPPAWHRMTRASWWETGIDSHDEPDCPGETCPAQVVQPGEDRYALRDGWMEKERVSRGYSVADRLDLITAKNRRLWHAQQDLAHEVQEARWAGLSWAQIGQPLAMSAEDAEKHFTNLDWP